MSSDQGLIASAMPQDLTLLKTSGVILYQPSKNEDPGITEAKPNGRYIDFDKWSPVTHQFFPAIHGLGQESVDMFKYPSG